MSPLTSLIFAVAVTIAMVTVFTTVLKGAAIPSKGVALAFSGTLVLVGASETVAFAATL